MECGERKDDRKKKLAGEEKIKNAGELRNTGRAPAKLRGKFRGG